VTQTRPAFGPTTVHRRPRRPRLVAAIALVTVAAVASVLLGRRLLDDRDRHYLSTDGWPAIGQGAYQVGDETPRASAHEEPVPIASVAKVMTALLVLERHPLGADEDGPTLVVTAADVADTAERRHRGESVVPVRAGERLTERDALMALLLPSANNVAVLLARQAAGSVDAFVREMNDKAADLGMSDTTYTDPSGFDPATVSTAADQLQLARAVAKDPVLGDMMAVRSYRLPVAGRVQNTDTLLGRGGFVGMKTGSDDAAGGCFMFHAYRSIDGFNVEIIGVVLGQHGHDLIDAGLYAAKQLVDRVAPQPAHA
jgi:D-alanyl-D-alanine carboxypeptidase (penicillin-binding protein 5/6)